MLGALKLQVKQDEIIDAIKGMKKKIEMLSSKTCLPPHLQSIFRVSREPGPIIRQRG